MLKKKITGRPNTSLPQLVCTSWGNRPLKQQRNKWERLCIPVRKKKASVLLRKFGHTTNCTQCRAFKKNSSDPLYQLPILFLVLLEAYVWEHRRADRADGDRDKNVQQMCQCMLFCINVFIILPAWADVMQGLSACNNTLLQFPLQPAVKKQRLCASASLPAWLLLSEWTNWSAQAQHPHMEESTSPERRRSLEAGRKRDLGKVEGRRMGEWWTLLSVIEWSIVLFLASTLFLPE